MSTAPLLKINNIETYYDLLLAVNGVSLSVESGKITAILGSNGAGKTTVLRTIMGLLDDQPNKGTIEFDGTRIDGKETEDIVRRGISYIPEGREVFPELTARENLLMGGFIRKNKNEVNSDLQKVYEYFPVLAEREKQLAGTLSGGQQQMLAIGRALLNRPRLLLMDEPSLGLSPLLVKEIFAIIRTINEAGVTIILVEQNANMALGIAHDGVIMENGRFVRSGTAAALLEDKDVQEFYLGGGESEDSVKGYQRWKRKKRWR